MSADDRPWLDVPDLATLRAFLAASHGSAAGVWLVLPTKASGRPTLPIGDVVDELLCWGWIDSQVRAIDSTRSRVLATPRRPGSGWSKVNKDKVARLEAAGRIAAPGAAVIARARADGSWSALDEVETLVPPPDLQAALDACPPAAAFWARFPPSSQRGILEWLAAARRPATRAARVAAIVEKAAVNRKANFPPGRDAGPGGPADPPSAQYGVTENSRA